MCLRTTAASFGDRDTQYVLLCSYQVLQPLEKFENLSIGRDIEINKIPLALPMHTDQQRAREEERTRRRGTTSRVIEKGTWSGENQQWVKQHHHRVPARYGRALLSFDART